MSCRRPAALLVAKLGQFRPRVEAVAQIALPVVSAAGARAARSAGIVCGAVAAVYVLEPVEGQTAQVLTAALALVRMDFLDRCRRGF